MEACETKIKVYIDHFGFNMGPMWAKWDQWAAAHMLVESSCVCGVRLLGAVNQTGRSLGGSWAWTARIHISHVQLFGCTKPPIHLGDGYVQLFTCLYGLLIKLGP